MKNDANPYVALLREHAQKGDIPLSYGPNLKDTRGTWRERFPNAPKSIVVEIGCHSGKTLCELGTEHDDSAFIGLDITFKRVVKTARRAREHGLKNVVAALFNAKHLDRLFAPNEVDGFVMFFPDPWTKDRQAKHRLFNQDFLDQVSVCLKNGGFFWFKTDQAPYFEMAADLLRANGYNETENPFALRGYESTFERRFRKDGIPTYELFAEHSKPLK